MECDNQVHEASTRQHFVADAPAGAVKTSPRLLHVEVRLDSFSVASREIVCLHIERFLRSKGAFNVPLFLDAFGDSLEASDDQGVAESHKFIIENVVSISVSSIFYLNIFEHTNTVL